MLDSSKLMRTLPGQDSCDPNQVTTPDGRADHCIKPLNANYDARAAVLPIGGWSHTPMRVPDRPYLFEGSESLGPAVAKDAIGQVIQPVQIASTRSEEHTSELQSHSDLVCRLLLEKKKKKT